MNTDAESKTSEPKYRVRRSLFAVSFMLSIALIVIYWFQFDLLAPITMIPAWCWLVPAAVFLWLARVSIQKPWMILSVVVWLLFACLFVDEAIGLTRFWKQPPERQAGPNLDTSDQGAELPFVRVITLNCFVGQKAAAMESSQFTPDILLLQESPNSASLNGIASKIFGDNSDSVWGGDCSILARGKIEPIHIDKRSHFVHACVTLPSGIQLDVISLRLSPPVFRMDFWNRGFWNDHLETRQHHRKQLQVVIDHLTANHQTDHWVIGGDFNMVAGDGSIRPAFIDLDDTYRTSGSGLCNTATNDYPLFRVDQIWTNRKTKAIYSQAFRTEISDHRGVLADLKVTSGR